MDTARPAGQGANPLGLPDEALRREMEAIGEPAVLYLPGGTVVAVNAAGSRITAFDPVGRNMSELVVLSRSRRGDGSLLIPGDLPFTRALRGEVVDQGERIDVSLVEGTVYRAVVTSRPVVRDGRVVAALSVWHDFGAVLRDLADPPPEGSPAPAEP